jgi:monolysocardiolipin acyltransferase
MRYFKWGVSRLILEATECPDVVPMWIEGTDGVMSEDRTFPRFLPRFNKDISITFGKKADRESVFGDLRRRWQKLKQEAERDQEPAPLGVLNETLMYGAEAVELRKECTMRVRELVLAVRRARGHSDEDPKASLAQTWIREGPKREGKMEDGSWVRDV